MKAYTSQAVQLAQMATIGSGLSSFGGSSGEGWGVRDGRGGSQPTRRPGAALVAAESCRRAAAESCRREPPCPITLGSCTVGSPHPGQPAAGSVRGTHPEVPLLLHLEHGLERRGEHDERDDAAGPRHDVLQQQVVPGRHVGRSLCQMFTRVRNVIRSAVVEFGRWSFPLRWGAFERAAGGCSSGASVAARFVPGARPRRRRTKAVAALTPPPPPHAHIFIAISAGAAPPFRCTM
jgi:hypothetical protein